MDLARERGVPVPDEFESLHRLTPFAVEYRYEFFAEEADQPLDRPAVHEELKRLRIWVEARLAAIESQSNEAT